MTLVKGSSLRKFVPIGAVGGVIALAALLPAAPFGVADFVGYGYGNNCGVKGNGTHDHGEACPNRPFPGQGNGVLRILGLDPNTISGGTATTTSTGRVTVSIGHNRRTSGTATLSTTSGVGTDEDAIQMLHHGLGRGHGNNHHGR